MLLARALIAPRALSRTCCATQAFIDCYNQLRDELVNDELLSGQPKAAEEWLKEVRGEGGACALGAAATPPKKTK